MPAFETVTSGNRGRGRLSEESRKAICAAVEAGVPPVKVAAQFGCHPSTVTYHTKRFKEAQSLASKPRSEAPSIANGVQRRHVSNMSCPSNALLTANLHSMPPSCALKALGVWDRPSREQFQTFMRGILLMTANVADVVNLALVFCASKPADVTRQITDIGKTAAVNKILQAIAIMDLMTIGDDDSDEAWLAAISDLRSSLGPGMFAPSDMASASSFDSGMSALPDMAPEQALAMLTSSSSTFAPGQLPILEAETSNPEWLLQQPTWHSAAPTHEAPGHNMFTDFSLGSSENMLGDLFNPLMPLQNQAGVCPPQSLPTHTFSGLEHGTKQSDFQQLPLEEEGDWHGF